jgi:hypothetical protein
MIDKRIDNVKKIIDTPRAASLTKRNKKKKKKKKPRLDRDRVYKARY